MDKEQRKKGYWKAVAVCAQEHDWKGLMRCAFALKALYKQDKNKQLSLDLHDLEELPTIEA